MLDRRSVELGADAREQHLPGAPTVREYAHLDQLVREQVDVDLVQHCGRQAVLAHAHHRMQRVRPRAQITTFGGSQREHAG